VAALHWGLALLLAVLPFELNAGVMIAGLTFTNVELLALAVFGLWGAVLVSMRRLPGVPRRLALSAALFLVILCASALAAPAWRGAALKFTARQVQGALLASCLAEQLAGYGWPLARRLTLALLAGGLCSALLGLLELTESPAIFAILAPFKDQLTTVGGLLRLSATFAYANIAAMYYEAILPLLLVAVGLAAGRRVWWLCAGALLLYTATLLTYSRASLLVATVAVIGVAVVALWASVRTVGRTRRDTGTIRHLFRAPLGWWVRPPFRQVAGVCAGLLVVALSLLLFSQTFRVRLTEADVDRWYRAEYTGAALPPLQPNALIQTPVTIRNSGLVTWYPDGLRPVALSYHWLDAQTRLVVRFNGERTALARPVAPGDTIVLDAYVRAPDQPGAYILVWDMISENSGWFSGRGNPVAEVAAAVVGAPTLKPSTLAPEPAGLPQRIAIVPSPPDRGQLRGAALRLWRAHPLLGIGPDVFRHVYGPELGLSQWDDRIHTNNLYLEVLVGAGVAGLVAFLALVGAALWASVPILAHPAEAHAGAQAPSRRWWMALGCMAALATYLVHGTLDMFLEYSATYLLFWALIGSLYGLAVIGHNGDARPD
jgi:O-Antigen ligase